MPWNIIKIEDDKEWGKQLNMLLETSYDKFNIGYAEI